MEIRLASTLLVIRILSGCQDPVPDLVRKPPSEELAFRAVREDISRYSGESVCWGGTIANTRNFRDHRKIEVISRELEKDGRPKDVGFGYYRHLFGVILLDPGKETRNSGYIVSFIQFIF